GSYAGLKDRVSLLCVDGNFLAVHNLSQSALCVAALGLTHRTAKLSSTGATSGIGNVAAKTLAKMGARIVVVARDKSRDSEVELSVCEQRQRELARDRLDRLAGNDTSPSHLQLVICLGTPPFPPTRPTPTAQLKTGRL
ncbi:MAG: hypothetical protein WAL37_18795, partial [Xanthobacteraceae bacterium]